jgi:hypothetical protein
MATNVSNYNIRGLQVGGYATILGPRRILSRKQRRTSLARSTERSLVSVDTVKAHDSDDLELHPGKQLLLRSSRRGFWSSDEVRRGGEQ